MTVDMNPTSALGSDDHELTAHERRTAALVWILVFGSCLAWTGRPDFVIILPPRVEQLGTAIAVVLAFWLALKLNPRLKLRGSWPVWLYALLPIVALMPALSGSAGGLGTIAAGVPLPVRPLGAGLDLPRLAIGPVGHRQRSRAGAAAVRRRGLDLALHRAGPER